MIFKNFLSAYNFYYYCLYLIKFVDIVKLLKTNKSCKSFNLNAVTNCVSQLYKCRKKHYTNSFLSSVVSFFNIQLMQTHDYIYL